MQKIGVGRKKEGNLIFNNNERRKKKHKVGHVCICKEFGCLVQRKRNIER
jgi:hypothetical protein